ncbi:glycine betaine ABC transporter substrate-binding protein [Streptomyces sp. LHD-70]|uniref:glycine betaine ABC transporter substrate-binding protein n=1 Tax=Streptomyces sp. LHD-70 TaxID=3072140 RepID=UPI00280E32D8|nr:glycine betaine ABC transporter substrate-binding protein [Streptomyces sp. LHD-70]MDQ8708107.1 glycine betaine ABC transporter substrate-binding protein [Streptomyces sp. LHD-70]
MAHAVTRRTALGLAAAAVAAGTVGCSGNPQAVYDGNRGDSRTVVIGYIGWDENIANSYLWKELLERKGYRVQLMNLEAAALYAGVASGQLDVFMAATPQIHADYWDRFGKDFAVVGQWLDHVIQGIAVPTYVPVRSTDELKGREAELGGRIIGIEAGSGLMRFIHENAVGDYELQGYEIVDGSTPAMLAALDKALSKKEPIAVTLWKPHWAFAKYPMRLLKDPEGSFGGSDVLKVIGSKRFVSRNGPVSRALAKFHMTPEEIGSLELEITDAGRGKEQEAVRRWVDQNEKAVRPWTAEL